LHWARRFYFPELTRQVSRIGSATGGLAMSVIDDRGARVASSGTMNEQRWQSRRGFPLLFVDPLLIAIDRPADLPRREWAVVVEADEHERTLAALPFGDATRTLFVVAFAAGVLAVGLAMTSHAARASAQLADMRSDFVSTMTHELKTPLATLRAIGDTVASGRVSNADTVKEYAQLVVQESRRLTRLVDNSLAYARITDVTEVYHFEALEVGALLDEAAHGFASQLSARGFTVEAEVASDLPPIRGDRTAVGLLLDNLIDNAIRYSGESRWLAVRASQQNRCVRIAITDQGIGIAPDELPHVVKKFVRGRNAVSGGSGLGLAIVQRVAAAHGGRLHIDSTLGRGTTASVEFPIADEGHAQADSGRRG
jgi:signal transduction histidine kinase